ncbi:cytochrome P450 [Georgenia subflava]|uniref:Cytochrome P450 n=1 Tax=Georgenia subflava TaxID=1622177 RepID=A0A6N7EJ23_9MICO|nr:cytochrome P450 [Georgenia subflava]MPV37028.1 cytochrome P450 [Georgenia subflava]
MTVDERIDWDPRSGEVQGDQIAAYDEMRGKCPVAHSAYGNWTVFGHADTLAILQDHETYSNEVSAHLSVPNGMDPPTHTVFRQIVDRYYTPEKMAAFEPACRAIAAALVAQLPRTGEAEFMAELAEPFANHVQCAFMGWPESLREPLREWTKKNHRATLALDRAAMSAVALEFDGYIRDQLDVRRAAGADAPQDATTELLTETVDGRPLTDEEIVSIVRNWTVGELGTIAASVGIIAEYLATHPEVQQQLRENPAVLEHATDEILRIHAPLIANRRRTTKPVTIGDREIPAGEKVMVLWASANRDESVFGDPDEFRLDRDPADNLLYGTGIHYCPGAPLARLELRVILEELFAATTAIEPAEGAVPARAAYPGSGYTVLPLRIR